MRCRLWRRRGRHLLLRCKLSTYLSCAAIRARLRLVEAQAACQPPLRELARLCEPEVVELARREVHRALLPRERRGACPRAARKARRRAQKHRRVHREEQL